MPSLPRYVFFGCCLDKFHSTNVGEEGYSAQILEATLHFRKLVKTSLVGNEDLGQFWVTDTLACLGTIPPTMPEKLNQLRSSLGPDGVHLSEVGRMHLFDNLAKVILDMKSGTLGRPPKTAVSAASSSVTGKTFYWRGFVSDRGSVSRPAAHRGRGRAGEGACTAPEEATCTPAAAGAEPAETLPATRPAERRPRKESSFQLDPQKRLVSITVYFSHFFLAFLITVVSLEITERKLKKTIKLFFLIRLKALLPRNIFYWKAIPLKFNSFVKPKLHLKSYNFVPFISNSS